MQSRPVDISLYSRPIVPDVARRSREDTSRHVLWRLSFRYRSTPGCRWCNNTCRGDSWVPGDYKHIRIRKMLTFDKSCSSLMPDLPGTRHMEPPLATLARNHREVLCRIAADTRLFAGLPRALAPVWLLLLIDVLERTSLSRGSPLR